MIIAISGTPGTGKTTLVKNLRLKGYQILDLNQIINEHDFVAGYDSERDSKDVDLEKLNEYFNENIALDYKLNNLFIDGHLSHNLTGVDLVIVLRCHPRTLEKRLEAEGYKASKIRENMEAEAVDVIIIESIKLHGKANVYEIDVTNKNTNDVSRDVVDIIEGSERDRFQVGNIDWSEEIMEWY